MKPIEAPLPCYAIDYEADDVACQKCPHSKGCRELMGDDVDRVAVNKAKFSLVPDSFHHRSMKVTESERDLQATYDQTYTLVFGTNPVGAVRNGPKVVQLAEEARCSVKMFMFTCMFGHLQQRSNPNDLFNPAMLATGLALHRVNTYANACRSKYASFNITAMDQLAHSLVNRAYDLNMRMLASEVKAGKWIIEFKLFNDGHPYDPMLRTLEDVLDPNWLAIEPRYSETLLAYSRREIEDTPLKTRNKALEIFGRIKKHRNEALSNFLAREQAMPEAVDLVLSAFDHGPFDFQIVNKPVTDSLRFWYRLGLAIQHFECVKLLHSGTGIYAVR